MSVNIFAAIFNDAESIEIQPDQLFAGGLLTTEWNDVYDTKEDVGAVIGL